MSTSCQLPLGTEREAALIRLCAHAAKPYLRERAAVLLAIAHGASIRQAAQHAGLKPHDAETHGLCLGVVGR